MFIYSAGPSPGRDEGSDETDDREEIGDKNKDGMQMQFTAWNWWHWKQTAN